MNTEIDIVIVGGGAAGIAAALRLENCGFSILLLEASARLGGRAWTFDAMGFPLDLGCGWLHSADRNPWSRIAEAGNVVIDRREAVWGNQHANLGFSSEGQRAAKKALAEWQAQLPTLVSTSDCAGDALPPDGVWNPYIRFGEARASASCGMLEIHDDEICLGAHRKFPEVWSSKGRAPPSVAA